MHPKYVQMINNEEHSLSVRQSLLQLLQSRCFQAGTSLDQSVFVTYLQIHQMHSNIKYIMNHIFGTLFFKHHWQHVVPAHQIHKKGDLGGLVSWFHHVPSGKTQGTPPIH